MDILLSVDNEYYYKIAISKGFIEPCDFVVRGYSQGDSVEVWQVGGSEYSKEYLTNLFYDYPIRAVLTISEIPQGVFLHDSKEEEIGEFYLDELLTDYYIWDRDQIINNFHLHNAEAYSDLNKKYNINLEEEIKKYLLSNLPYELKCEN